MSHHQDHDSGHAHAHGSDHAHDHVHAHGHEQSHAHEHSHTHSHDHAHDHAHAPSGDGRVHSHAPSPMPFDQQLQTLFTHWIRHNDSHAGTYSDWAKKARDKGMEKTAALLDEIADMTAALNRKIEEAARSLN